MRNIVICVAVMLVLLAAFPGCMSRKKQALLSEKYKSVKQVKKKVGDIPVLEYYRDDQEKKPLLIVSHGFTGNKEAMNKERNMEELADLGYHVVVLDNRMHGERPGPNFTAEAVKSLGKINIYTIRKAIKETADDVKILIDYYEKKELIDSDRIGMMGFSMGGFVTYRTMVIDDRIKVALPYISSPYWDDIPGDIPKEISIQEMEEGDKNLVIYSNEYSPGYQPEKFYPRAILGQVGDSDKHFKVQRVMDFYRKLKNAYGNEPDKVKLIVYPNVKHEVTAQMWQNGLEWLKKNL